MEPVKTYRGSCHCRAVRFELRSQEITTGCRCNCSICIRRGAVMSSNYVSPDDFDLLEGTDTLSVYQFGDKDMNHYFCKICGIFPFSAVASVPAGYQGSAKPGCRRVNLGCIEGLDPLALEISIIDGRSL